MPAEGSSWEKSGLVSIKIKAQELDLDVPEEIQGDVLAKVKEMGAKQRRALTDDEFRRVVEAAAR